MSSRGGGCNFKGINHSFCKVEDPARIKQTSMGNWFAAVTLHHQVICHTHIPNHSHSYSIRGDMTYSRANNGQGRTVCHILAAYFNTSLQHRMEPGNYFGKFSLSISCYPCDTHYFTLPNLQ